MSKEPDSPMNDGWTDFTHAGQRWSFNEDELAQQEEDGGFHFLKYHGLAQPTVESVSRVIDQL